MPEDVTSGGSPLVQQLTKLVEGMRADARTSLETFLLCGLQGLGGTLIIQAPCTWQKRPRYEAGYRSERYLALGEDRAS